MKIETFKFTKEVQLVDCDGVPIREGSVLQNVKDGDRGVVTNVIREGDKGVPGLDAVGDLCIASGPGSTRHTNKYSEWKHVPHNAQTYSERRLSWTNTKKTYEPEYCGSDSQDEWLACSGIMALLPDNVVDETFDSYPEHLGEALLYLERHLSELAHAKRK